MLDVFLGFCMQASREEVKAIDHVINTLRVGNSLEKPASKEILMIEDGPAVEPGECFDEAMARMKSLTDSYRDVPMVCTWKSLSCSLLICL